MSFSCFFGRHKPSQASMARHRGGEYVALCESCGVQLERNDDRKWRESTPLVDRVDRG